MKTHLKHYFLLVSLSFMAQVLWGQGIFFTTNVGYGVGMGNQTIDGFYNSTMGNVSTTEEQVYVSLGKGINAGAAVGYMFNKNIGVQIDVSYLFGGTAEANDIYLGGTTNYSISSNMLRLNPSLIISSGSDEINLYAKFGCVIGSGSVLNEFIDNDNGDMLKLLLKLNGGNAFGLSSGIGAVLKLNENVSFISELNMINMTYTPKRGEYIEATYNGVDELRDMTTYEKKIEFVDVYTYNNNFPAPDSEPSKVLKQKLPFGSVGINIGVRVALGKNN